MICHYYTFLNKITYLRLQVALQVGDTQMPDNNERGSYILNRKFN